MKIQLKQPTLKFKKPTLIFKQKRLVPDNTPNTNPAGRAFASKIKETEDTA